MKHYEPGDLNRRIAIKRKSGLVDSEGHAFNKPYVERAEVWANVYDKGTDSISSSGEIVHSVVTEIAIRYIENVLQGDVLIDVVSGRIYEQTAPPMPLDNRKWLYMICREVVRSNG